MDMNIDYLNFLATADLTTYHYKIILLLNIRPYTPSEISDTLNIARPNISKALSFLETKGFITLVKLSGRNKYYKAVIIKRNIDNAEEGWSI